MVADQSVLKIYSDRTYTHTTMVRHQGTTVAFAMDDQRRIYYAVLDMAKHDPARGELDMAYWTENPVEVAFPREIVQVGYGVAGTTAMPVVKRGGRIEARPDELLQPEETDRFLSTTARLSAAAPFQVVSDGTHVVILRQAIGATHADAVFALTGGGASGDATRTDYVPSGYVLSGEAKVPVVADTLLCDRFLLVDGQLKSTMEIRFRRSRHKTRPESATDSLGATDMDGRPFFEPTQELTFIRNLTQGRFTALLTPTAVQGQQRWQIFAHNATTGRIDSFNIEQATDGLFNMQGSRYWTSPDPCYRDTVYERTPGKCPFTGRELVPLISSSGHAEIAVQLNGTNAYLDLGAAPKLAFGGKPYTIEAWIRPQAAGGPVLTRWNGAGKGGFQLSVTADGHLALEHNSGTLTSTPTLTSGRYTHVAAVFDGTTATLYLDGESSGSGPLAYPTDGTSALRIGAAVSGGFFAGLIDEVRIWNRARSAREFADDRSHRLVGNESGLLAYYRLDEGTGTRAYDQTDSAAHATLIGETTWVTSDAPVGDHPGVRRDSFTLSGRDIVSGLSATLYYQQEDTTSGYDGTPKPAKRQARVLLACSTRSTRSTTDPAAEPCVATVDFGVGVDGRLAQVPDVLTLPEVGRPVEETADKVTAQQEKIALLDRQVAEITADIAQLTAEKANQEAAMAAANDLSQWNVRLRGSAVYGDEWCLGTDKVSAGVRIKEQPRFSDEWRLVRVDGRTDSYGHPVCTLRHVRSGLLMGSYVATSPWRSPMESTLLEPAAAIPEHALWYMQGDWQMPGDRQRIRLQHVASGRWLFHGNMEDLAGAVTPESTMYTIERVRLSSGTELRSLPDRLAQTTSRLNQRNRELAAKQAELPPAREELARLTVGLLGTADLILPVPHLGIDRNGLSSSGALLEFARSGSTPFLMDSAAGRVALYFRGVNAQFFAAYLDTGVVRGVQQLAGGGLTALFTARDPGVDLSKALITVAGSAMTGLCDLTITCGSDTETWRRLPRRAAALATVVNGVPSEPVPVGTVAKVTGDQVELKKGTAVAVPGLSYLLIGDKAYLVQTDHPAGSTKLSISPAGTAITDGQPISLITYDYGQATASQPGVSLDRGSRWIAVSTDTDDGLIPNGTATALVPGHSCRWRGDSPGRAFTFDGTAHRLLLPAAQLKQITVAGDLTVEAWVNPYQAGTRSRVLHASQGGTKASLALIDAPPLGGGMDLDSDDLVTINGLDLTSADFTIECWLKPAANRRGDSIAVSIPGAGLNMGFMGNNTFNFTFTGQELFTTDTYPDTTWHHWAITYQRATRAQVIYRDDVEVARRTATAHPSGSGPLTVGKAAHGGAKFLGQVAELRAWTVAKSAADLNVDKDRRVSASEPGLVGAWTYTDGRFADNTPHRRHGTVSGTPMACDSALKRHRLLAAVANSYRTSREIYPCGQWAHLAAVYRQSWALRFDGSSWADTPDDDALDVVDDLTIEVFATIDALGARQGLVSKGRLGEAAGGSVPYQLAVGPDGKLEFAFEEPKPAAVKKPEPAVVRIVSSEAITSGFHRIAVIRQAGRATQELKGSREFTFTDAWGKATTQKVDMIEGIDVNTWDDIRFVVDGREIGTTRYTGPGPRGNDGTLEIGRAREGSVTYPLRGTISEVRIWGKAREIIQLGVPVQPRDSGLIARWTFEENTGNVSADLAGSHSLRLRGARWTADSDPSASSLLLYRNGQTVPCDVPETNLPSDGDDQLTLGGYVKAGAVSELFAGILEEVRFWRTARSPEQILDNMFTRLKGDKQDLVAYWPFDSDSTQPAAEAVRDQGLRGNHLALGSDTTRPKIVLSTAPVATDTAAVRSAVAGVRTPFHELIGGPPAAVEYADMQYTATGEAYGVLKRCYGYLVDGRWRLVTGYKVGDLVSEWVSQIQFDPQLIGYIEGAPPVPSENLTGNADATGCSSITFTQANAVTSALSSSHERSVTSSLNVQVNAEVNADIMMMTAPMGFGIGKKLVGVTVGGMVRAGLEFANSWTDETSLSQGTSTQQDTSATLTGHWENPDKPLNSAIGPRFVPTNHGYALVQSETADVYALRLAHSGALVAYRIQPNPDIPKDWNIISFPINAQYTKQGTLDGAVGFNERGKVPDPDYPMAATRRGDYSYFKPREAYALKRRILRERQQLENYYANVSTETHTSDPTAERAARLAESFVGPITNGAKEPTGSTAASGSFANRNLANTYVWTADGGFFAETTGTVDVVTETIGGSYRLSGSATLTRSLSVEIVGAKFGAQFDVSLGGAMTTTRTRRKEATRSNSLQVSCIPSGDLQRYDANGKPQFDPDGAPLTVPGKVDAYRFMSFYLGQDTANFDDFYHKVIDPIWLETSTDPNAAALRQARQSDRKPPCWRILHRVTFISRILPPVPTADAPPLEQTMRHVDVESNYELIRRLDPYLRASATTSLSKLAEATRAALTSQLPELLPHSQEIVQFLADYYGVID